MTGRRFVPPAPPPRDWMKKWEAAVKNGRDYQSGNKRHLFDTIYFCAANKRKLPDWAREMIIMAHLRSRYGRLKSWEEIFGKPFPGKSRKGILTKARALEVWIAVRQRVEKRQSTKDQPIDEGLFEEVGKELGVGGHSTVSKLYYQVDKNFRPLNLKASDFQF
jgi:hypothetical protein